MQCSDGVGFFLSSHWKFIKFAVHRQAHLIANTRLSWRWSLVTNALACFATNLLSVKSYVMLICDAMLSWGWVLPIFTLKLLKGALHRQAHLFANMRLSWKCSLVTNALACFTINLLAMKKLYINSAMFRWCWVLPIFTLKLLKGALRRQAHLIANTRLSWTWSLVTNALACFATNLLVMKELWNVDLWCNVKLGMGSSYLHIETP